jgi:hypothetical protein
MPHHDKIDYPIDEIRQWIQDGKTQQWIADELRRTLDPRVTAKLIYKVCKKHGIECQRTGPRAGEGHPEWTGGRILTKHGYWKVFCPDHPECQRVNQMRMAKSPGYYYRKQKYVWEHRLVMEKHLGRYLKSQEVVHHINGDKGDNRLENLQLFQSNAEHLAHDLKGKCPKWTPEGKARILAATHLRVASQMRSKLGEPALPSEIPHSIAAT